MYQSLRRAAPLLFGLLLASAHSLGQSSYTYQTVDYPGAPDTQVFGINDRGDVTGIGILDVDYAFVYSTRKETFTFIDTPENAGSIGVSDISDSGTLVGSGFNVDFTEEQSFVRNKKGEFSFFTHPDAALVTVARGINNKGIVTGFRDDPDAPITNFPPSSGFIYDPKNDEFTDIVPSFFTIAQGINSRGDVVGHALYLLPPDEDPCPDNSAGVNRYGWLRDKKGNLTYFIVNGGSTSARGINDAGVITGFFTDPTDGVSKGFVTQLDGSQCQEITVGAEQLLVSPDSAGTFPQGINNAGVVSGNYRDIDSFFHGFVATPD